MRSMIETTLPIPDLVTTNVRMPVLVNKMRAGADTPDHLALDSPQHT